MPPERRDRVHELFQAVIELTPERSEEFLRSQCGDDQDLYLEIQRMVEDHRLTQALGGASSATVTVAAPARSAPPVFQPGQTISGRYRICRYLNRGGMGEVYEAEDLELRERVALKTLLPRIAETPGMIRRFKQEIQLSRKIAHPGICRVFDLARDAVEGSADGVYFLTMEFLDGETLSDRLRRGGRIPYQAALPLLEQMADALDAAHRTGVIHRDFKPGNVMLVAHGEEARAVVTDFGLAHSMGALEDHEGTRSLTKAVIGTPAYMAPELLTGQRASVASDIYALGMTAYQMLTGTLPSPRTGEPVQSPRAAAPELDALAEQAILRALDPNPERRFASGRQFLEALRGDSASMTVTLPAVTRRRALVAGLGILALGGGAVGWREWRIRSARPSPEASALYQRAADDIRGGAYFAATRALDGALQLAPHFSLAHARLAEAWIELDLPERGEREMLLARREDNSGLSSLERLQLEAVDLTATRDYTAAVAKYEAIRRLSGSKTAGADVDLGRAYEKAGQIPKALECYRRAAEATPPSAAAWLKLGVLYSQADPAKSAPAFQKAEELYQLDNNLEGLTEVALRRGIDANRRSQLAEAAGHLKRALETARLAGNVQRQIYAMQVLATNAYLAGDSELVQRYGQEALDSARANQMETLAIGGLNNLGNAYLLKRDFAKAAQYYGESLDMARRNSAYRLTAVSLLSLASLHDQMNRSDESGREAKDALSYFEANGYALESFQCLTLLGRSQRDRGDFAAALDSFQRSLSMAEKTHTPARVAQAHASLGSLLSAQEQYPQALPHYQKNLEMNTTPQGKGFAALQCGNTLRQLGRAREALAVLDAAGQEAGKFPSLGGKLKRVRAAIELNQNHYAEAARQAREAMASPTPLDPADTAELTFVLGLALLGSGAKKEGLRQCEAAAQESAKLSDAGLLLAARLALAQARLENGDSLGARTVLQEAMPALGGRPESRWRALALAARASGESPAAARGALDELTRQWGAADSQTYLARPDIRKFSDSMLSIQTR